VVAEHDLRKHFRLRHKVTGAHWDDERGVWEVRVTNLVTGEDFVDTAEVFVNNDGILK
jgi:cation diffusion facilitator CzcD-associated flavoprotein CzcO